MFAGSAIFVGFAVLLGWLKTLYFLKPFGLSPAATGFEYLLESWYVLQNLAYFAAILWLVIQTRRLVLAVVALVYAMIPLATHYLFLLYDRGWARIWIDHQHTWLKGIPAVLLAGLIIARVRGVRVDRCWRHGRAGWALLALVVGSWGVSAAKHFGSYDAERILHRPDELLPRVALAWKGSPPAGWGPGPRHLLLERPGTVVVVELAEGPRWRRRTPLTRSIPRSEIRQLEVSPPRGVQPGGQWY